MYIDLTTGEAFAFVTADIYYTMHLSIQKTV